MVSDDGAHDGLDQPSEEDLQAFEFQARNAAASMIQSWWVWHHNRSVFKRMQFALQQSSGAITSEVLKQLCPTEASLLSDPTLEAVVRFRFGGTSFPPDVLYKVFLSRGGSTVVYISGKRMIKPASEAAVDALEQMGTRKFVDLMAEDAAVHEKTGIFDELDVTSMKEYMQYASSLDKQPAFMGGRDNGWRTLEPTTQHGILLDFMEYAHGGDPSSRLMQQIPEVRPLESLTDIQEKLRLVQERSLVASRKLKSRDIKGERMAQVSRKKHLTHLRELYGLQSSPDKGALSGNGEPAALHESLYEDGDINGRDDSDEINSDEGSIEELDDDALYSWSQSLPVNIDDDLDLDLGIL